MKKALIALSMLGLGACTSGKFELTEFKQNTDKGIEYYNYNLTVSNSNTIFTHIATIQSKVLNSNVLQATGFEKQSQYAFITYNTAGNEIRGGLDIVSVATLNTPTLLSSVVSENSEYAEAKIKGQHLYMVGQKKDTERNYALLTVMDVSNKSAPVAVGELVFMNGYYATSIDIQGNKAYITVPNEGVKVVDITSPTAPVELSTEGSSQGNSLYVRRQGSSSLVLGGSASHNLSKVTSSTTTVLQSISSQVQEAPARFVVRSNTLYTNGGFTGLTILDKINTPSPELKFADPVLAGTGNGITVDSCKNLYLAQGDQGLLVMDVSDKSNPVSLGRFDFVGAEEDCGSANNVFYMTSGSKQYVFVADGLGGVKIVKVTPTENCECDDEDDNEEEKDGLMCKVYDLSSTKPSSLPNFSLLTPVGSFVTSKLNVTAQTWANSFPLFPTPLKTLKEWYGIVCEGMWESKTAEQVKFYLGSDDGSKLYLDGALVLDNDGLHSPLTKTAHVNVLKKDYEVKIEYYQGPQTQIQLELQLESATMTKQYMEGFYHE